MTSRWILSAWITGAIVAAYRSIFAMPGTKDSNDKVPHSDGDTEADGGYGFFGMLLVIASWIAFCLIILLMPVFILAAEAKMLVGKLYRKWFPRV